MMGGSAGARVDQGRAFKCTSTTRGLPVDTKDASGRSLLARTCTRANAHVRFIMLTCKNAMRYARMHAQAPGLDMLRPTLPAPSPNSSLEAFAHVQFNDMMIMNRTSIL